MSRYFKIYKKLKFDEIFLSFKMKVHFRFLNKKNSSKITLRYVRTI